MRVATISYVPPRGKLNSEAFMQNLSAFKATHDLFLYSDDPSWQIGNQIANPEIVKHPKKFFAVNNLVWLFGLNLAIDLKLDYFLYLESDCRVRGDNWDGIIFDDAFREGKTPLIYGCPVTFNISQSGPELLRSAIDLIHSYMHTTNCPAVVHGAWPGSPTHFLLFPNGALGIYHVETMKQIFDGFRVNIGKAAMDMAAWDHSCGKGMFDLFGNECVSKFQFSTTAFSGYGDEMTTPAFRRELLMSGKVSAIHQWKGPESLL